MALLSEAKASNCVYSQEDYSCLCCFETVQRGGMYHGGPPIAICTQCLQCDGLQPLGILLGDAILDLYKNSGSGQWQGKDAPHLIVKNILTRLELAMHRAISTGYFYRNRNRNGKGLLED